LRAREETADCLKAISQSLPANARVLERYVHIVIYWSHISFLFTDSTAIRKIILYITMTVSDTVILCSF